MKQILKVISAVLSITYIIFNFSSCTSSTKFAENNSDYLTEIPKLNDEYYTREESLYQTMISSGQFSDAYDVVFENVKYEIGVDSKNIVCYISTADVAFNTTENLKVGNSVSDVKNVCKNDIIREPGWAYFIELNCGWYAAFVQGESMTDDSLAEDSKIEFFFKRR